MKEQREVRVCRRSAEHVLLGIFRRNESYIGSLWARGIQIGVKDALSRLVEGMTRAVGEVYLSMVETLVCAERWQAQWTHKVPILI